MAAAACGCAELKLVDLAGEQKSEAYLEINPYGQVPGLTDDSNGLKLGESHAILRYLATQYKPSLYPGNPASRARIDMCMDLCASQAVAMETQLRRQHDSRRWRGAPGV